MNDSILDTIKKMLGLSSDYDCFDADVIICINSVFAILKQFKVGPEKGFNISDNTTNWNEYIDNEYDLNVIKNYMFLKVRMMFDPPQSQTLSNAYKEQISELEFRTLMEFDNKPIS